MRFNPHLGVHLTEPVHQIVSNVLGRGGSAELLNTQQALEAGCLSDDQQRAVASLDFWTNGDPNVTKSIDEAEVLRSEQGIINVRMLQKDQMARPKNPNAILIADNKPSAKARLKQVFGADYHDVCSINQTWLSQQDLVLVPVAAGHPDNPIDVLLVLPKQCVVFGFFVSLIQHLVPTEKLKDFRPRAVICICPQLRESLLDENPYVIHYRGDSVYECYGTGLYPGLNGKKFLYALFMHMDILDTQAGEPSFTFHASAGDMDDELQALVAGSQGGKTEHNLALIRQADGSVIIAWIEDEESEGSECETTEQVVLHSMPADQPLRFHTDDMLHCNRGLGRNRESGLFDRTDDFMANARNPEMWPKMYLELLRGKRGPLAALNYATGPGEELLLGDHLMGIKNGRLLYGNSVFDNPSLGAVPIASLTYSVRSILCRRDRASAGVIPMIMRLNWLEFFLVTLSGLQSAKSASIEGVGSGSHGGIRAAGIGTQYDFMADDLASLATALFATVQDLHERGTEFYLTSVGASGAFTVRHQFLRMSRELISHWRNNSECVSAPTWRTSEFGFMGDVLDSLSIGGQEVDRRVLEVGICDRVGPEAAREGWKMIHRVMTDELRQYLEFSMPDLATEAIRCFVTEMPKSELSSLATSC